MTPHLPPPDDTTGPELAAEVHAELLEQLGGTEDSARDQALIACARRLTLAPREAGEAVDDLR